uniref:Uncharacterized protein n=1 Tax=Fagus sylvatica TaxID=28930 RepID=A0A2N9FZE5_FAGSY
MEEFHSRKVIRREAGETSNGATTEDAQTHSNSIHTNTLAERLKMKVIFFLRDEKDLQKYYEPRVVSLGPIHHRNPKYQLGEQYKLLLTYEFVEGSEKKINDLYEKIREKIKDLRDCFKKEVTVDYDDEELAWLLFVDGCAILQYIYCAANDKFEELKIKTDSVAFGQQDLFLLENQLPYCLLKWLMSWSENEAKLKESIESYINEQVMVPVDQHSTCCLNWISSILWKRSKQQQAKREKEESRDSKEKPQEQKTISVDPAPEHIHLLDYLRKRLLDIHGPNQVPKIKQSKHTVQYWQSYRKVQELRAAGIHVERSKNEKCCLRDISFTTVACLGYLFLPPMIVDDSTRPKFLNLIAYEMCLDFENDFGVTSYISFLDSLIDEANDVKMLRKAGVLYNCLGSDEEVAKLFNEIGTDLVPNTEIYKYVRSQIQDHYKNKWMTWMAQFFHNHFSSPWTIFAFCGVLVGLGLTGIQTWFTVHPAK